MKSRLNHIGVVVRSIAERADVLLALGLEPVAGPEPDPTQKVTACFFDSEERAGVHVELLEPTDPSSPIANFLEKRGGGIHHLCFEVEDLDSAARELEGRGCKVVSPPVACLGYDRSFGLGRSEPTRIAFFMSSNRVLIELLEKGK